MGFEKWIRQVYEDLNSFNPIEALANYRFNAKEYKAELKAFHHTCWEEFNTPILVKGRIMSNSMFTFILCAHTEDVLDDPRFLKDFPLIQIHDKWLQEGEETISRLSLSSATNLLFGLEWFLFSNVLLPERKKETINQARELFRLLRNRIFFFIQSENLPTDVLNMKDEYSTEKKRGIFVSVDTSHLDYDSDEEVRKKRVEISKEDLSEYDLMVAAVNSDFCYDMDTLITLFEKELYKYDTWGEPIQTEQPELSILRCNIIDACYKMDEEILLNARRMWLEKLQMLESYQRIYRRKYNIHTPKHRQIITNKNDVLQEMGQCTSKDDLLKYPRGLHSDISLRITTDALFCLWGNYYEEGIEQSVKSNLFFDHVRNIWIVRFRNQLYKADSFTHGWRLLCIFHPEKSTLLDKFFFKRME